LHVSMFVNKETTYLLTYLLTVLLIMKMHTYHCKLMYDSSQGSIFLLVARQRILPVAMATN